MRRGVFLLIPTVVVVVVVVGIVLLREEPDRCVQTTMHTPAIEPRPTPNEAATAFLALDGFGPEFVKDPSAYSEEFADVFDGPGSEVRYSTGRSPTARFSALDTGAGWIISGVDLTCPSR